jgi:hypothetical protein
MRSTNKKSRLSQPGVKEEADVVLNGGRIRGGDTLFD